MDCETIWQVVISTPAPAPIRYAVPPQAVASYAASPSPSGFEVLVGLVVLAVGLALFLGLVAFCLWVAWCVIDALFNEAPAPSTTMSSVSRDARRQIDGLSESYVRSAARLFFGR